MKMITTAIVALFAVTAFAADPAATTTPAPAAKTKETKTTKTKETKTTTATAAPTEDCTKLTGDAQKACTDKAAAAAHK